MDRASATRLIKETFQMPFEKQRFYSFLRNLLNTFEDAPFSYRGNLIPDAFENYIQSFERIGKYSDEDKNKIDLLVVHLKRQTSLERARTAQRNFIARYLNGGRGDVQRDAALVAFVSPDSEDWRFSLVKMEYKLTETPSGKVRAKEEFTPAKRYSFLVGSNETSHTAQSRLVPILEEDVHSSTLKELEDAFSVEKATKEFFEKYRDLLLHLKEALDDVAYKNPRVKADFESKHIDTVDFSKKLLGQIVFLYFLQRKGWFGVPRGKDWGEGDKHYLRHLFEQSRKQNNNYFNKFLEPLFYEALRLDRPKDYYDKFECRIPFLNGGLFDPLNDYDWQDTDIELPNKLFSNSSKTKEGDIGDGILDIFDRYNFTVREDEPLEKEVAVDPEMLGRAYEKFNAIRSENFEEYKSTLKSGNKGEETKFNKQYGVYYTPREIVHYMCQESLANYLAAELDSKVTKDDIETLIKYGESVVEHDSRVLNEGRETERYSFKLPESVRAHAKFIDEKLAGVRVCDPAVGSGAFPVGMMNEIVRTRNALTPYISESGERSPYHFKRHAIQNCLYGVDIDPGATEICKLRLWLSLVVDEESRESVQPLPNLDYKIVQGNSLLGVKKNLFNQLLFNQLEELKPLYFNETSVNKKQVYKKQIDHLISQITNGHKDFDFEVYFSEVFHQKKGFDVIIANPPYVQIKQIPWDDRKIYEKKFKSAVGRFNLFYFFLELSGDLVRRSGVSAFIVPDRLLLNTQCSELRNWLLKQQTILEIDSFKEGIFEAVVDSIIIIYRNTENERENIRVKNRIALDSLEQHPVVNIPVSYFLNSPNKQLDLSYNPSVAKLLDKIKSQSVPLGQISDIKDGIIQGKVADKLFLNEPLDSDSKPLLFGEDVTRYSIQFSNKWVNYKPSEMMKIEVKRRGEGIRHGLWMRTPAIFERRKILTRQTADEIIAAFDMKNYYYSNTLHGTTIIDSSYNPLYVLALMNSRLTTWYYRSTTAEEGKVFAQIKIELLRLLPIKKADGEKQSPFIELVDKILAITENSYLVNATKQAKVNEYEKEIDQLVYELYNLTPEEIKVVEGATQ